MAAPVPSPPPSPAPDTSGRWAPGLLPDPLYGTTSRVMRWLPHNDYTPAEVARALGRVAPVNALPGRELERRVEVTWRRDAPRRVSPQQLAHLVDPEYVTRIRLDWSYPPAAAGEEPSRLHGELVRPRTWGVTRRGLLVVEGGGRARAAANGCLASLARRRPATARARSLLASPVLGILLTAPAVVLVVLLAASLLLGFPSAPSQSTRPALVVCALLAVYSGIAWAVVAVWSNGTQLVEPARIAARAWSSPAVWAALATTVIAALALLAAAPQAVAASNA